MRNYIHVMLCANLFVAQLVFVVGVERTENKVEEERKEEKDKGGEEEGGGGDGGC